jgi:hypothetical protein
MIFLLKPRQSGGASSSGRSVESGIKLYTPQEQQARLLQREQQQQQQVLAVLKDRQVWCCGGGGGIGFSSTVPPQRKPKECIFFVHKDAIDRTAAGHSHGTLPPLPPPPPPPVAPADK